MLPILIKTLPFFALIGLGYAAARQRFFGPEATTALTRFVFSSRSGKPAERMAVAVFALVLFRVDPVPAGGMIAASSLPVAGNVYILAQHYGVAPQRVSASILISTTLSILTVSYVIAWVTG